MTMQKKPLYCFCFHFQFTVPSTESNIKREADKLLY